MAEQPENYILVIGGDFIASGTEAELVEIAKEYDENYEILTPEEYIEQYPQ